MDSRGDIPKAKVVERPPPQARPRETTLNHLATPFPTFDVGLSPVSPDFVVGPPLAPYSDIASREKVTDQTNRDYVCKETYPLLSVDIAYHSPIRAPETSPADNPLIPTPGRPAPLKCHPRRYILALFAYGDPQISAPWARPKLFPGAQLGGKVARIPNLLFYT